MKRGQTNFRGSKGKFTLSKRSGLLMLAVMPVAALSGRQALAVNTDVWTGLGANSNWLTPNNWTGNIAPSAGDSLDFSTSNNTGAVNNFPTGTAFDGIVFDAGAGNFSLSGNAIVLGDTPFPNFTQPDSTSVGPTNYFFNQSYWNSLVNNAPGAQIVTTPITLSTLSSTTSQGGFHVISGGTGGLAINGAFSIPLTATADFSGTVTSSTIANDATGVIPAATFNDSDLAATVGGSIGAYTGYLSVSGTPALASTPGVNVKWTGASGNATLAAAGTTDMNSLVYDSPAVHDITMTTGQVLRMGPVGMILRSDNTANGNLSLTIGNTAGTGTLTAGGNVTGTPGELILDVNGFTGCASQAQNVDQMEVQAVIADNGTGGTLTLVKTGLGSVRTTALNTFTGPIYIDEGRLRSAINGGFTTGNNSIYVSNGAQLYFGTGGATSITNNIWLAGVGVEEGAPGTFIGGAMRLGANTVTLVGTVTLTGDARITARGATGVGSSLNGPIVGNYNLEIGGAATGILFLGSTANAWTGNLTVSSGNIRLGNNNVLPNGPGFGNVIMNGDGNSGNSSVLDLDGHTATINALDSSALTTGATIVTNSTNSAASGTLTMGNNNASGTYNGSITDSGTAAKSLSITKIDTGTETLGGTGNWVGNTTITGGTLAISASTALGGSTITVGASGKLDLSALGGGYTLAGSGTPQTLVNTGTVLGDFSVNTGGTVTGTSPYGNVTLNGGNVSPGASAAVGVVGTTTFGNLTVNSGNATLDLSGAGDKIAVTGTLNVNGTFDLFNNINPVSGTYTVITAGSIVNGSNIIGPSNAGRTTFTLTATSTTVQIVVAGNPANLTWNNSVGLGDGSSWDFSTLNWTSTAPTNPNQYFDGDNVNFTDANNGGHYIVNVNATVSPGSIIVNNTAGDYVFSGSSINGIGSLTKNGNRALTLNNSNNFSGGVFLNNGTLNIGNPSALGTGTFTINGGTIDNTTGGLVTLTTQVGGNVPISIGGSFNFAGAADTSHDINFGNGPVTLTASSTINIAGAGSNLTIGGAITGGANGLGKSGPGNLTITGAGTYTGNGTLSGGTIRVTGVNGLGSGTDTVAANTTLIPGGNQAVSLVMNNDTLAFSAQSTLAGNLTIGGGTVTIDSFDPAVPATSVNSNFTGSLNGTGNIILVPFNNDTSPDSNQAFRFNSANTSNFSGNIIIDNNSKAELFAAGSAGLNSPAGTATIYQAAGDWSGSGCTTITTTNGLTEFNLRNNTTGNIIFPNNLVITGTGLAVLNPLGSAGNLASATMGNLTIGDAGGDAQTLGTYFSSTLDHPVIFTNVSLAGANVTFDSKVNGFGNTTAASSDLVLGNVSQVSAGTGFSVNGLGTVFLTGTSTFTGAVNIQQGTLGLKSSTALNATNDVTLNFGNSTNNTNGTLDLGGFTGTVGALNINNAGAPTTSQIIGSSSTTSTSTLNFAGGTSSWAGIIQDSVNGGNQTVGVTVSSGSLDLSAANTYSGPTSVTGGTLTIDPTGSITGNSISTSAGGNFTVSAGGIIPITASLTNNGTTNFAASQSIAGLASTTGGVVNLSNAAVLTVTTGGSYAGAILDGGSGGGVVVPVGSTLTTGPINAASLSISGKESFTNTTVKTLSKVNSLTIAGTTGAWTGALDLTSSRLIVEDSGNITSDIAMYKNMVANTSGNTTGIFSSTAATANTNAGRQVQVVAVVNNAVRLVTDGPTASNFGTGVGNVDANSILITAAYLGDANLDGVVDIKDLQVLANNWQKNVTDWSQGDFNGDGIVDIRDLQFIANDWQDGVGAPGAGSGESFGQALALLPEFGGTSSVPEPMSLAMLGLGGVVLASRRRRK